jgi:hypothetical protein
VPAGYRRSAGIWGARHAVAVTHRITNHRRAVTRPS